MKATESMLYGLMALVIGFILYEQVQFRFISQKDRQAIDAANRVMTEVAHHTRQQAHAKATYIREMVHREGNRPKDMEVFYEANRTIHLHDTLFNELKLAQMSKGVARDRLIKKLQAYRRINLFDVPANSWDADNAKKLHQHFNSTLDEQINQLNTADAEMWPTALACATAELSRFEVKAVTLQSYRVGVVIICGPPIQLLAVSESKIVEEGEDYRGLLTLAQVMYRPIKVKVNGKAVPVRNNVATIKIPAGKRGLAPGDTARQEFTVTVTFPTAFRDSTLKVKGMFNITNR